MASLELVMADPKSHSSGSKVTPIPNHPSSVTGTNRGTRLNLTQSLNMRAQTPRVMLRSATRRYVHSRDVSVGSQIPTSIRSYTPSLIALIDHTKGLPNAKGIGSLKRAMSNYPASGRNGIDRPQTARTLRELNINANSEEAQGLKLPVAPETPPGGAAADEKDAEARMVSVPALSNAESNQSVVKHGKQDSGTFLVNEGSADVAFGMLVCVFYVFVLVCFVLF